MIKNFSEKRWLSGVVLFFTVIYFTSYAQVPENYSQVYAKIFLETSQKDFKYALQRADSLYTVSETPHFKARSLMLSASLYQQTCDFKIAVDYAVKAEQELTETKEYLWKAKIFGFLSTQYRNLGLFHQSKKYADKTLKMAKQIDNPAAVSNIMGLIMQEKTYYELEMKNYNRSIDFIKKSQHHFEYQKLQNMDFLTANNEQLLGLNEFYLGDYDKALDYYNKALERLNKMPDNYLKGIVFNGIAQVYIGKNNLTEAKKYIDKAEKISEESECATYVFNNQNFKQ